MGLTSTEHKELIGVLRQIRDGMGKESVDVHPLVIEIAKGFQRIDETIQETGAHIGLCVRNPEAARPQAHGQCHDRECQASAKKALEDVDAATARAKVAEARIATLEADLEDARARAARVRCPNCSDREGYAEMDITQGADEEGVPVVLACPRCGFFLRGEVPEAETAEAELEEAQATDAP